MAMLTIFFFLFFFFALHFVSISNAISKSGESATTYVIHMDESTMKSFAANLDSSTSWHNEVLESIRDENNTQPPPKLIHPYSKVFCGFSAHLTDLQLQTLRSVNGFVGATKDKLRTLHTTHSPEFLGLELGKGLWSGDLGSDVIIGVIDTGVWPEHPSFNDANLFSVPSHWKGKCQNYPGFNASSCNRKLIGAAVFYKGYEKIIIKEGLNDTSEYKSPRDSDGHGTHTASTAGGTFVSDANILGMAYGTAAGMSPGARIAAYKVCFQYGCADSDILAGIDKAVEDGVDVLSISIGGHTNPLPYYNDSVAVGAFGAVRKGVIVSLSAGNSGPYTSSVVNVAPWMMTVAASSTDREFLADVHLGGGIKLLAATSLFSGHPINNISLVYNQLKDPSISNANLCLHGSLSRSQVKGKVVICDRGISTRVSKGEEVKRAGGVAMILANTPENGEDRFADPHVLPTAVLGASAANIIREYAKSSKNATVSIKFKGTVYHHNRAPTMAAFSSRGPSALDPNIMKPDITAPGLNMLAAFPPNISPTDLDSDDRRVLFNIMSGTSMSCPHVSGILALVKSVHRDWSPAAIKSALMTTAYVLDSNNSSISDMSDGKSPATPFAFGSGHVHPNKATDPGLIYNISTHDYLNYLCSLKYNSTEMQIFSHHKTCHPSSGLRPGDLNYPSFSVDFRNESKIIYKRTVTNVAASSDVITYRANVSKPQGVSIKVKPNVLKFTTKGEKLSYNITFKAKRNMQPKTSNFSFGYIKWVSGGEDHIYSVRSPIAVIWN